MFNGKNKAVTFSFDDGVTQDKRLIEILDKYGLKCTFNINSGLLGQPGQLALPNGFVPHNKVDPNDVAELYKNHEVAVHTLTHPNLTGLGDEEVFRQVEEDRKTLGKLTGREIVGMAYPCGGVNNDDRVAEIIRKRTGVKYSRTITSTHSFELQKNLYRFNPTTHIMETEKAFELAERFIELKPDSPKLFYIWGHSYEFDILGEVDGWRRLEAFCMLISRRADIFYGTNYEVLL
jgi:Predicted xylanase/chitin deacetylase